MVLRIIGRTLLAVVVVIVALIAVAGLRMLPAISTPPFHGSDGMVAHNSIAIIERWRVNGTDQSVIIRGRDRVNPVLLFVHGGPGSSETAPLRRFDAALEDHFVVVYWDQRYAGQSFDSKLPIPEGLTIRQYVDDLGVVVDRLRARFDRDRVGILAHSWGTVPGILYAEENPQKLYAYVGVGQVANVPESEKRSYAFALHEARVRHVAKAVAELERLGPPPRATGTVFTPRGWLETFGGAFHGNMTYMKLIAQSLGQREANWRDLVAFWSSSTYSNKMLQTEFAHFVIDDRPHEFFTPIFLLSGRYDQQSEATVAHHFFERVTAPHKVFVWFENSAHNPPFEEPKAFTDWISSNVAPLGDRGRGGPVRSH